jgi:hypothetical protein
MNQISLQHYLTWATNSTAVCGINMVGARNSRRDTDPALTTCATCKAWLAKAQAPRQGSHV